MADQTQKDGLINTSNQKKTSNSYGEKEPIDEFIQHKIMSDNEGNIGNNEITVKDFICLKNSLTGIEGVDWDDILLDDMEDIEGLYFECIYKYLVNIKHYTGEKAKLIIYKTQGYIDMYKNQTQ